VKEDVQREIKEDAIASFAKVFMDGVGGCCEERADGIS
jgi:hypothetical protein